MVWKRSLSSAFLLWGIFSSDPANMWFSLSGLSFTMSAIFTLYILAIEVSVCPRSTVCRKYSFSSDTFWPSATPATRKQKTAHAATYLINFHFIRLTMIIKLLAKIVKRNLISLSASIKNEKRRYFGATMPPTGICMMPHRDVRHLCPIPSRSWPKMAYIPGEDGAHPRHRCTKARRICHNPFGGNE